jgi:FkbM family methyltransferase
MIWHNHRLGWSNGIWAPYAPGFIRRSLNFWTWLDIMTGTSGGHEDKVIKLAKKLRGEVFVDVGANAGYYTRLLSQNFQHVLAIEPHPFFYDLLTRTCPANCEVHRIAVANNEGQTRMRVVDFSDISSPSFLGESSMLATRSEAVGFKTISVRTATLTSLLRNYERIDLVKVDVEGAEWLVIEGADSTMPKIQSWIIELHDRSRKNELEDCMSQYGYVSQWLEQDRQGAYTNLHGYFYRQS